MRLVPFDCLHTFRALKCNFDDSKQVLDVDAARDLAATGQHAFSFLAQQALRDGLHELERQGIVPDGIVVTGGCALNVKTNELIRQTLGLPVFVPSAPHDGGLPIGQVHPAARPPSPLPALATFRNTRSQIFLPTAAQHCQNNCPWLGFSTNPKQPIGGCSGLTGLVLFVPSLRREFESDFGLTRLVLGPLHPTIAKQTSIQNNMPKSHHS